jgi:hypothetical protein
LLLLPRWACSPMLAVILLDPRLGFLALSALLVGAATPLAIAWVRLLPPEKPPFSFERSSKTVQSDEKDTTGSKTGRESFAITLLIFVTLSFLWQIPGAPRDVLLSRVASLIPEPWFHGTLLFCRGLFLAIPILAVAYSAFRPHKNRIPLIFAGILVPLLWLTAPLLRAAFLSP